jgi:hypothetical protein
MIQNEWMIDGMNEWMDEWMNDWMNDDKMIIEHISL